MKKFNFVWWNKPKKERKYYREYQHQYYLNVTKPKRQAKQKELNNGQNT